MSVVTIIEIIDEIGNESSSYSLSFIDEQFCLMTEQFFPILRMLSRKNFFYYKNLSDFV